MNLEWKKIRGSIRPSETDFTSSSYFVYLRRNIQEVEKNLDEMMGKVPEGEGYSSTEFEYEEAKISKSDYPHFLDIQMIMQNVSDQELKFQEELIERDERLESIAQSLSELELTVMENNL